jgi:UPF0755 protein
VRRLAAIAALLLVAGGLAAFWMYRRVNEPYARFTEPQRVDIAAGSGPQAIGRRLVDAGVIRDRLTFRAALWLSGNARRLQAGEYLFDRPSSALEVIGKLARGEVDLLSLTFPEGLTLAEMAVIYEDQGFGPAASFVASARDASSIRDVDPQAQDLEGYLFPDTYALPRRTGAAKVVALMTERFRQVLTPDLRAAAAARGLNVRQLVTLASLVEKETGVPEERPTVASVYANRLRLGMSLQCDPTVIYALLQAGRYDGNLRRDDLAFDSPYNTYRYPGLPPGPIAAPGKGALEAAAAPAESDYLYFVSRNDGSHVFSRTLSEHNANVQKYQVEHFRQRRLKEAAARRAGQ